MENASKALLIAGEILIGMLVVSIIILMYISYRDFASSYSESLATTEIRKFNTNFTKFEGRTDISIGEIVSLYNFIENYNKGKEEATIDIKINGIELTAGTEIENIKKYSDDNFRVNIIKYNEDSGLVQLISFTG